MEINLSKLVGFHQILCKFWLYLKQKWTSAQMPWLKLFCTFRYFLKQSHVFQCSSATQEGVFGLFFFRSINHQWMSGRKPHIKSPANDWYDVTCRDLVLVMCREWCQHLLVQTIGATRTQLLHDQSGFQKNVVFVEEAHTGFSWHVEKNVESLEGHLLQRNTNVVPPVHSAGETILETAKLL